MPAVTGTTRQSGRKSRGENMAKKKKTYKKRSVSVGIMSTLSYLAGLNQLTGGSVHRVLPPGAFESALRGVEWSLWKPVWEGMGIDNTRVQGALTVIATKMGKTALNKANANPKLVSIPGTITVRIF